ncbi:protein ECERIFERUM 2 [Sesamum indicum]|uniref:Protein ECERIFERUM 2 n=1 Tax=Sesamum indicum TaxID=4182 RepID=A0A6I9T226_SESIN|nr:protein ECERIFERUM 2 [Sesamum indicum]
MSPSSDLAGENVIYDIKLSTVVPASITAEGKTRQLTNMDLAMKLHYITTVHFFGRDAAEGLSIQDLKNPMFQWLQPYYPICGRIRRHDGGGRPFIKCNDSGVRIVEAKCAKTVDEWLETVNGGDHHRLLVYKQPLVADNFGFTPLVFLQFTEFKCGGLCVGMSWAHILGDAFSATECINMWGKFMANRTPAPHILSTPPIIHHLEMASSCRSLKLLDPLGDNWLTPNNLKMQMDTFHLTEKQLSDQLSGGNKNYKVKPFELISAIVWKSLAKIRDSCSMIVTVCKKGEFVQTSMENELPGNMHQVIGIVEAEMTGTDPLELAELIAGKLVDETSMIEKRMEGGSVNGHPADYILYGANLTFVNLEDVNLCGLKLRGQGPVFANLSIGGVGDEGAVVVVPYSGQGNGSGGRTVNVILPEPQLLQLKNELRVEWGIL